MIFTDSTKRKWDCRIDLGAAQRVKRRLKIDLLRIAEPQLGSDEPLLTQLETDLLLFVDLLYAILEPIAHGYSLDDEGFASMLSDGENFKLAHDAFWESLRDFIRSLPGRQAAATAIDKVTELVKVTQRVAMERMEAIDVEAIVEKNLGASSSNSPEPSELSLTG